MPIETAEAPFPSSTKGQRSVLGNGYVFFIAAILGCSYAVNAMDRLVFPALLGPIDEQYGLTLAQGGFLSNVFTLNIALFSALSGWFMTRLGRKKTLIIGMVFYSIFTLLMPLARNFNEIAFYRLMTGAGEAMHITAIFSMIGAYFGSRRGAFIGINNAFYGLGGFLGPFFGTRIFVATGMWSTPFFVYGVVGLIAALAVILFVPRDFAEAIDSEKIKDPVQLQQRVSSDAGLFNRNSILVVTTYALVGYAFFSYAAMYPTYLRTQLGFTIAHAGAAFGMFGIGTVMAFFLGWLGERLKRVGMLVALLIATGVGYLMFHGVNSLALQIVLSFCFGALISGYLIPQILALTQRSVEPHQINYAMSLAIAAFALPGLFAGLVFGKLVSLIGWDISALISVVLPILLGFVAFIFVDKRRIRGA